MCGCPMSNKDLPVPSQTGLVTDHRPKSMHNTVAPLQWAVDSAQGRTDNLDWVDSEIVPRHRSFSMKEDREGRKYRHRPYGAYLPRTMAMAAQHAQEQGEPTVLEGLLLLFARMEWLVSTRRYYWSPMSPVPKLLASLVEAMGIDNEIHRDRPDVLSRLTARLPTWNPARGTVQGAKDLLVETVGDPFPLRVAQLPKDKPIPMDPDIQGEVFACHDVDWWARRMPAQNADAEDASFPKMDMRLTNGFIQFQTPEEPMPLHHEDVLVGWKLSDKFPTNLLRLLPAWISIRVVVLPEEE